MKDSSPEASRSILRPTFKILGLFALMSLILVILWHAIQVLLLLVAATLVAVALSGLARVVSRRSRLSYKISMGVTLLFLSLSIVLFFMVLAPSVGEQVQQLSIDLPTSLAKFRESLARYELGRRAVDTLSHLEKLLQQPGVLSTARGVFSTSVGFFAGLALTFIIGIYLAFEPELYREGALKLLPREKRTRARETILAMGETLKWWLIGRFLAMLLIGVLTTIGLAIIGVPLALVLGLLALTLEFVPNFGPIIATIPAVLLAWVQSPKQAIAVAILYFSLQQFQGFLFSPFIERRTVKLPQALTITSQLLFGILLGVLGATLAIPITAVLLVLIQKLYLEDVLGEKVGKNS